MTKNRIILLIAAAVLVVAGAFATFMILSPDTVKAEFNVHGGIEITDAKIEVGKEFTLPIPERDGYEFEGWYIDSEYLGEPVAVIVAEKDVAFHAKWAKLYPVVLNLNGGTLTSSGSTVYLKAGAVVYEAVQNIIPQKTGFMFGAWLAGDNELLRNTRMPEDQITLSAKYKVGYTVEIWLQNLTQDGYEKVAEDIKGYEYPGVVFTSEPDVDGFFGVEHAQSEETLTLSEDFTENIFKNYFDRESYTVTFRPNYPEGEAGERQTATAVYGIGLTVPSDLFSYEGYCFMGWAATPTGGVEYTTDYIYRALYNKDGEETAESDNLFANRNTTLYAVWSKGYTDIFGGDDYIYLFDEDSDVIYLSRGDRFFKGEYRTATKAFIFIDINDKTVIEGKLYENGMYSYRDVKNAEYSSTLYQVGVGLVASTKIYFDAYNGITYSVLSDGKTTESEGTFVIDGEGYYVATFTSGELSGQTLTFVTGTVDVNEVTTPAFQVRNEEEYGLGTLVRYIVNENFQLAHYGEVQTLTLNGFGVATFFDGNEDTRLIYQARGENIELVTTSGSTFGVVRLMEDFGGKGYMLYDSVYDQEFNAQSGGGKLTLDGLRSATYKEGGTSVSGYFVLSNSLFGGTIVTLKSSGQTYKFLITATEYVYNDENGNPKTEITYSFERKNEGYAEYYYKDEAGTYYGPMLVINQPEAGRATVYGYTQTRKYEKVAVGTYALNQTSGLYIFTVEEHFDADVLTNTVDMSKVKAFVFSFGVTPENYSVTYWYSMTDESDTETDYEKHYTAASGSNALTLVSGFAIYKVDGFVVTGTYSTSNGLTVITVTAGANRGKKYYLELNQEDNTFVALQTAPYTAYVLNADGSTTRDEYIAFDGKGGAVYTVITKDSEGKDVKTVYEGSFRNGTPTKHGIYVYIFEAEGMTFEFIQMSTSSSAYFAKYNLAYNGDYSSDEDGLLILDGFGGNLEYVDAHGSKFTGRYYIIDENVILMAADSGYRYFDLTENKRFTVRGEEYGTYVMMDNQSVLSLYLELDGYGGLIVFRYETDAEDNSQRVNVAEGEYTQSGGVFTLNYESGGEHTSLAGKLSTFTYGSTVYNSFVVIHDEVVRTYVNEEDWSVLILDNQGNAVKYDKKGNKETGTYTLITDSFFYYVNSRSTDAYIYKYDTQSGTATPINFEARGYYTVNLESLLFSQYGFVIINGETRSYYSIEDDTVTIYRKDAEAESANEYGFVAENFGAFNSVKDYDGKTYYENSGGFALNFNRAGANSGKYPVLVSKDKYAAIENLSFTPSGSAEFAVLGSVRLDGKNVDCVVVRYLDDEGEAVMYVMVSNYRFYITTNYTGIDSSGANNSTYTVEALSLVISAPSYTFLNYYYIYYVWFGMEYENNIGVITITYEFDEDGQETSHYVNADFGPEAYMIDADGNPISIAGLSFDYNEDTKLYTADITADDGYTYRLYFVFNVHQELGVTGSSFVFTRVQKLETDDNYSVEVERVVASDASISRGSYYSIVMSKDGEVVPSDSIILLKGNLYYIVRTLDDGKITQTKYYKLTLVEVAEENPEENPDVTIVPPYESVVVSVEEIITVYTEDEKSYVDINQSDTVTIFILDKTVHYVTECTYDEVSETYTVKTSSGKNFAIKVQDGTAEITEIPASGDDDE